VVDLPRAGLAGVHGGAELLGRGLAKSLQSPPSLFRVAPVYFKRASCNRSKYGTQSTASFSSCSGNSVCRGVYGRKPVDFSTSEYQYLAQLPSVARGPAGQ